MVNHVGLTQLNQLKHHEKQIKIFLKEFNKKCINGAMLDIFKNDRNILNQLISDTNKDNAPFGIWLIIKTIISNLGEKNSDQLL